MKSSKVPAGYWRCSQCGQLNENEYELCMACGMVRDINAALPKELEGRKRAAEPEVKPQKKSPKGLIIAVAVVLVLALGASLAVHGMASSALKSGDYTKAVNLGKLDLIFGGGLRKDAALAYSEVLCAQGDYEAAVELLSPYADDEGVAEAYNEAVLALIDQHVAEGHADEALALLDELEAHGVDVSQLRNAAQFSIVKYKLYNTEFSAAIDQLEKLGSTGKAAEYMEVTELLQAKHFCEAALLARENSADDELAFSEEEWGEIFTAVSQTVETDSFDMLLDMHAALNLFHSENFDFSSKAVWEAEYDIPVNQELVSENCSAVDAAKLRELGTKRAGKILVVWEIQDYETLKNSYYVAWDIMNSLPEELYPKTAGEVEFIVRLSSRGAKQVWYDNADGERVVGVREYLRVYTNFGLSGNEYHKSADVWGEALPGENELPEGYADMEYFGGHASREKMNEAVKEAIWVAVYHATL